MYFWYKVELIYRKQLNHHEGKNCQSAENGDCKN